MRIQRHTRALWPGDLDRHPTEACDSALAETNVRKQNDDILNCLYYKTRPIFFFKEIKVFKVFLKDCRKIMAISPCFYTTCGLGWPKSLFKFSITFMEKPKGTFMTNPILNWSLPSSFPGDPYGSGGLWTEAQVHPVWRPTTACWGPIQRLSGSLPVLSMMSAGWSTIRVGSLGIGTGSISTGQAETAGWSSGTAHFPGSHLHLIWRAPACRREKETTTELDTPALQERVTLIACYPESRRFWTIFIKTRT